MKLSLVTLALFCTGANAALRRAEARLNNNDERKLGTYYISV